MPMHSTHHSWSFQVAGARHNYLTLYGVVRQKLQHVPTKLEAVPFGAVRADGLLPQHRVPSFPPWKGWRFRGTDGAGGLEPICSWDTSTFGSSFWLCGGLRGPVSRRSRTRGGRNSHPFCQMHALARQANLVFEVIG